jgi:hypothetical protein
MKDITIPLPNFLEEQIAEVEVKINGKRRRFNFRVESFPWVEAPLESRGDVSGLTSKIDSLRSNIESYAEDWELIQIFTPRENAKHIQVLFRQRELA